MDIITLIELVGTVSAIIYLILVSYQERSCWDFYIISSILYVPVFWSAKLYADAILQFYFIAMGVYASVTWGKNDTSELHIVSLARSKVSGILLSILTTGLLLGYFLSKTDAGTYAYFDALICVGSIVTTVLTARKILEGWYFWIAINILATCVFALKGLNYTVFLYAVFSILSIRALIQWRRDFRAQESA